MRVHVLGCQKPLVLPLVVSLLCWVELQRSCLRDRCNTQKPLLKAPCAAPGCCHQVGDVIYIEANSGAVKRVGRCDAYATEFDLEAEEYVPLPKVSVGHIVCVFIYKLEG